MPEPNSIDTDLLHDKVSKLKSLVRSLEQYSSDIHNGSNKDKAEETAFDIQKLAFDIWYLF